MPLVVPGPLRAAVDQEDDRVFLLRVEARRLEQPAGDLVAVGPLEGEALGRGRSSSASRGSLWWVSAVRLEPVRFADVDLGRLVGRVAWTKTMRPRLRADLEPPC